MTRHPFDGEQLTTTEIQQRIPALSIDSVRRGLKAGRNTTQAMLAFDPAKARSLGGKRSSSKKRGWGYA
jgi:hypothetical protein